MVNISPCLWCMWWSMMTDEVTDSDDVGSFVALAFMILIIKWLNQAAMKC